MALLLLTMIRTDLVDGWQRTLPPDTPNRFLLNIQPDQRDALADMLLAAGVRQAMWAPNVRGRLIKRNGHPISADQYTRPRAQRMVNREFNLSYAAAIPDYNRIVNGRPLNPDALEMSLEVDFAATLELGVGDTLTFDVAGQLVTVTVTSTRAVAWGTFQVNFFAILTPVALKNAPRTFLTSFHLPPLSGGLLATSSWSMPFPTSRCST
jgi:putative ABC transport system permease protein